MATANSSAANNVGIIVPILVALLVIAIILLLLCAACMCWPGVMRRCWSRVKGACLPGKGTPPSMAMEISPSVGQLPRAPARPPQNIIGNSYVEEGPRRLGSTLGRARVPTPPPGSEHGVHVNQAYSPAGSLYDTVDPSNTGIGHSPHGQQSSTLPATSRAAGFGPDPAGRQQGSRTVAGTMPSQQYLHAYPRHFSESETRLPYSDSESTTYSVASEPTPYFRPPGESSDFAEPRNNIPQQLATYKTHLEPFLNRDGRKEMSPNPHIKSGEFHPNDTSYQDMQANPTSSPVPRISNVPPLPSFPQGHPLSRDHSTSNSPVPYHGKPEMDYNRNNARGDPPSVGGSSTQSEPHDLSIGKKSNSGQYPAPLIEDQDYPRDYYMKPRDTHIQSEPEDLSRNSREPKSPTHPESIHLRDRNQRSLNSEGESSRSSETEIQQPLPRDPIRTNPGQSQLSSEQLYANSEAEEQFPDFKELALSLELPGAHGEEPSSPNPAVVPPVLAQNLANPLGLREEEGDVVPPVQPVSQNSTDSGMYSDGRPGRSNTYLKHT